MKLTVGTFFEEIRREKGLSQAEIARISGLSAPLVWKIENDRSVRWETLHLIIYHVFRIFPGSEHYEMFHRLWLADRQARAEAQKKGHAKRKVPPHVMRATSEFRSLIRALDEPAIGKVLAAARRAACKLES